MQPSQHKFKPSDAAPEQAAGRLDSPFLTMEEGAQLARFDVTAPSDPVRLFRAWVRSEGIPVARRGRRLLIERRVLEAYLRGEAWTTRRRSA
jgi:hypothetical protein